MEQTTTFSVREIAERIDAEIEGDGARRISGVASLRSATADDISYVESSKYRKELESSRAGAVIAGADMQAPEGMSVVRVKQPGGAWARVVELFHPRERRFREVSRDAWIGKDCEIGEGVGIGPGTYVGHRVRIGKNTEIYPGCTIGDGSVIGDDCLIYPRVVIYHACTIGHRVILHAGVVVGGDGYGYTQEAVGDPAEPVRHRKVPQVGTVIIEDDVEVGANSTIDRAALEATVVGKGTKVDNLVMVAHNCRVGRHALLVGQSGLSGSVDVGHYATVAGQAGVAGHLKVGNRAIIGGQAGVMKDVGEGEVVLGSPALPHQKARRAYAQIERLYEFRKTIQELEKRVAELERSGGPPASSG